MDRIKHFYASILLFKVVFIMANFWNTDTKEIVSICICKNSLGSDMTEQFMQNFSDFTSYASYNDDLQMWQMDIANLDWWLAREKEENVFNSLLSENGISKSEFLQWLEENNYSLSTDYETQCKEQVEYLQEMIEERKK